MSSLSFIYFYYILQCLRVRNEPGRPSYMTLKQLMEAHAAEKVLNFKAKLEIEIYKKNTFSTQSYGHKPRSAASRNALERSNKVREVNSKGGRQKRSDMNHSKVISRANNNRKC